MSPPIARKRSVETDAPRTNADSRHGFTSGEKCRLADDRSDGAPEVRHRDGSAQQRKFWSMRWMRSGPPGSLPGGSPLRVTGEDRPIEKEMLTNGKAVGDRSPSFAFAWGCGLESRSAPAQMQLTASFCAGSGVGGWSSGVPDSSHRSAQHPSVSDRQSSGQATRKKARSRGRSLPTDVLIPGETQTNKCIGESARGEQEALRTLGSVQYVHELEPGFGDTYRFIDLRVSRCSP